MKRRHCLIVQHSFAGLRRWVERIFVTAGSVLLLSCGGPSLKERKAQRLAERTKLAEEEAAYKRDPVDVRHPCEKEKDRWGPQLGSWSGCAPILCKKDDIMVLEKGAFNFDERISIFASDHCKITLKGGSFKGEHPREFISADGNAEIHIEGMSLESVGSTTFITLREQARLVMSKSTVVVSRNELPAKLLSISGQASASFLDVMSTQAGIEARGGAKVEIKGGSFSEAELNCSDDAQLSLDDVRVRSEIRSRPFTLRKKCQLSLRNSEVLVEHGAQSLIWAHDDTQVIFEKGRARGEMLGWERSRFVLKGLKHEGTAKAMGGDVLVERSE